MDDKQPAVDEVVVLRLPIDDVAAVERLASESRALTGATRVVVLRHTGGAGAPTVARATDTVEALTAHDARAPATDWLRQPALLSIAAVTGDLHGCALQAALACDLRLFADDVVLAIPESAGGRLPAPGVLGDLAASIGRSRALELALTGRRMGASEAAAVGLANLVVAPPDLDAALDDLVTALLATPRDVAVEVKALLRRPNLGAGSAAMAELAASVRLVEGAG